MMQQDSNECEDIKEEEESVFDEQGDLKEVGLQPLVLDAGFLDPCSNCQLPIDACDTCPEQV